MVTHISVDLETWGTEPGCDLRSIGAVVFSSHGSNDGGGWTGTLQGEEAFYMATNNPAVQKPFGFFDGIQCNRKYPLRRDVRTAAWWAEQSEEAQMAFDSPEDLHEVLRLFGKWLRSVSPIKDYYDIGEHERKFPNDVALWFKGSHFDEPILKAAYKAVGLPVPWHYRAPRDVRASLDTANMSQVVEQRGVLHNALDDAISQAHAIIKAYRKVGSTTAFGE